MWWENNKKETENYCMKKHSQAPETSIWISDAPVKFLILTLQKQSDYGGIVIKLRG